MQRAEHNVMNSNQLVSSPLLGLNILVAEDSPTVQEIVNGALADAGARAYLVADGAAAVRFALDRGPDAVVLDIGLDGISGYHACRLLRDDPATRDLPIVILTGRDVDSARYWGMRAGADECVTKDAGMPALVAAIVAARARRSNRRAVPERAVRDTTDAELLERMAGLLDRELVKATILNDVSKLAEQMDDLPATLEQLGSVLRQVIDTPFAALVHDTPPELFALFRPEVPAEELWQVVWGGTSRPEWAPAYMEGRQIVVPRVSEAVGLAQLRPQVVQAAPRWEFVAFLRAGETLSVESAELLRLFAQAATLVVSNARLHAEAARFALTDDLTGVYNRRYFQGRLEVEIERSARTGSSVSLILLDLDEFKRINDAHGHLAGDTALHTVAQALSQILRPYDVLGRFGGEEFVILAPDTPLDGALSLAERARATVAAATVSGTALNLTASFGVSAAVRGTPDVDVLLRQVDEALFRAKQAGSNRVEAWTG